jgi:deaminated glutathione amidase
MGMKTIVAVGEMTSTANKVENLDQCEFIIEQAAKFKARMVCLPENFAFLGSFDSESIEAAEAIEGPTIIRLRKCAKKCAIWLSLGGFQEKSSHLEKIYNSHIIINDCGQILAKYRKTHLFSAILPDGNIYDEAKSVLFGDDAICLWTPFFMAGLSICYDLRFPNLFARLRNLGAQVLLIPAAFTATTGKAHWEILLRARAIETQSYVLAAAQVGRHNKKRITYGHSMIIDPWGRVLAQCDGSNSLGLAEIDLFYLEKLRAEMPIWQHRHKNIDGFDFKK